MSTNFAGSNFRLYPWQVKHYIHRGGPSDPVTQTTGNQGSVAGGYLAVGSTIVLPPVPGTQTGSNIPLQRVQSMVSTGTFTTTTGTLATNTGGIYMGTIPGGAWVDEVEIYCYTTLAGGTSTSVGVFYTPSENQSTTNTPGYQPTTLYCLGYITSPTTGNVYTSHGVPAANGITTAGGLRVALTGFQTGPGTGPTGSTWPTINAQTLASDGPPGGEGFAGAADLLAGGTNSTPGDIDLYFVNFLIAGGGTVATAGVFAAKVGFTGLVG